MNDSTINDLTNRLDDLERRNRTLKRSFSGLGLSVVAVLIVGAALPSQTKDPQDGLFETIRARKVVIGDSNGRDRLVLELSTGEPTLKMFNHEGQRQVFLGIDELWHDTAYLSVSSRLHNGDVDKQAVLAATTSHPDSPGNSQLVLYDPQPMQKNAAHRHLVRVSSGLADKKPYLEIHESSERGAGQVDLDLLEAKPAANEQGVLLDTNSSPATLSGVQVTQ